MADKMNDNSVDVEMEKAVEMPREEATDKAPCKRKKLFCIGAIVLVALVIFAIVFPLAYLLPKKKNNTSAVQQSQEPITSETSTESNETLTQEISQTVFTSVDSPFNISLGVFNEAMTQGYASESDLKDDLASAAYFLLNQAVKRNAGVKGYESVGFGRGQSIMTIGGPVFATPEIGAAPIADTAAGREVGNDLNDFGTNNQEDNVEEGDVVVSDGTMVYAAYGDYIAIWNAKTGDMVATVQMPEIEMPKPDNGQGNSGFAPEPGYWYNPKPNIQSLLLLEDRLLVTVNGYGPIYQAELQADTGTMPIIYDYLATQVRLYSTADVANGNVDLVGVSNVNGYFQGVRAIGKYAHVMTTATINTYNDLVMPVERWNLSPYETLTDDQYVKKATRVAKNKVVPTFVDRLTNELKMSNNGELPFLTRITVWETEPSGTGLEELTFQEGMLTSLAQIHSIDLTADAETLSSTSAGSFIPSSWAQFYGATNALIIAGQGWTYEQKGDIVASQEATYLVGFSIGEGSTLPHSVGKLDGYLLNSHSIDVVDNILRVAVTIRDNWWWAVGPPILVDEPIAGNAGDTVTTVAEPVTEPQSSTENYIIILEMPGLDGEETGTMKELGRVKLGLPNEVFTAVRFFDNVSYAVTFERKDPLYVLDLSDPSNPSVTGELNITGFSSYLHSMNDDDTLLLAIGEEADEDGMVLGVSITVFDATDPAKPFAAVRYVIEKDPNEYSYSNSLNDFKATRYAGERLIIPIDTYNGRTGDEYHGFVTYKVNATHILPECDISYGSSDIYGVDYCYYCAYLPPRSMIFDGNLMTMKDHFIRSNDMDTCKQVWSLDVVVGDNSTGCCGRYWF